MRLKKALVCIATALGAWSMCLGSAAAQPAETDPQPGLVVLDNVVDDVNPTPPRARSASGCTLSNGGFAALNCVYVNGESTYVNYMRASMDIGGSELGPVNNICNRAYEFQYYRSGFTAPITRVFNQTGCGIAAPGLSYSYTHQVNLNLTDGSTACTRTKSNLSFNEWSPYACVYINA